MNIFYLVVKNILRNFKVPYTILIKCINLIYVFLKYFIYLLLEPPKNVVDKIHYQDCEYQVTKVKGTCSCNVN